MRQDKFEQALNAIMNDCTPVFVSLHIHNWFLAVRAISQHVHACNFSPKEQELWAEIVCEMLFAVKVNHPLALDVLEHQEMIDHTPQN